MTASANIDFGKKRSPEAIQQRKLTVLRAATEEFAEKGYAHADMDRIAEAAKVGKGTIYRYYRSKEHLFNTVAEEGIERLWEDILGAVQKKKDEDTVAQLKAAGKAFLDFFDENRALLAAFLQAGTQFRDIIHEKYLQLYGKNIQLFHDMVEDCMKNGIFERMDPRQLADTIGDMMAGTVYMWGVRREKSSLAQKWNFLEKIISEGILTA
jgi:AcrR family transcriptional regulator